MGKIPKHGWYLALAAMLAALLIDVSLLHVPLMSCAAFVLCALLGSHHWLYGSRRVAAGLFICGVGGAGYATSEMGQLASAERDMARTVAIAVKCYTEQIGHRPVSLTDLVPTYLARLPKNRSPLVGRIKYLQSEDKSWCIRWNTGAICSSSPGLVCNGASPVRTSSMSELKSGSP